MSAFALELKDLGVSFGGFKAVDGVSLQVAEGELRVLLGANGAGKTTLMDLISGKTRSSHGQVLLSGSDITNRAEFRVARAGIGRKFQIPSVFRELTVRQNLGVAATREPSILRNLRWGFGRQTDKGIDEILDLIGLAGLQHRQAADLSHGQTQWLELGLLIAQKPRVILLDEPTAGMTQAETRKTAQILMALRGRQTILVVEHDMAFVRDIAERITVLHLGRVLAEGSVTEIERDPKVRQAYLGSHGIATPC
ncbi:urea ABC transporter ATP-binding protein UrtD [Xylophilus rhododendri]|uniref:Urea ABC transporter ATP-binding protein UrtD n=1 Tax=Xylophilus rhododendri TaxID=2697032 RepID=A0A857IYZ3_9BURK|nr:urea ABC transporter ATP-binding protein UrtD [Xylophilus rhododendri]QHI96804.1 urea ABC transporter ATP-binding protein UrtD [Xylophilus rhododendri]